MNFSVFIKVKVKSSAKKDDIIQKNKDTFEVFVKEKPEDGKANKAVLHMVASFFGVPVHRVKLIKGNRQPHKIFEIIPHKK